MIEINQHIAVRALWAEGACTRLLDAIESGEAICGARKDEEGKLHILVEAGGAEEMISVQAILDLADLIRRAGGAEEMISVQAILDVADLIRREPLR